MTYLDFMKADPNFPFTRPKAFPFFAKEPKRNLQQPGWYRNTNRSN